MNNQKMPCLDLTRARIGNAQDKYEVALELDKISKETGFFTLIGHGIPLQVIESAHLAANDFFKLPLEEKNKCKEMEGSSGNEKDRHPILQGYQGLLAESISRYLGNEDDKEQQDCVEKFSIRKKMFVHQNMLYFPSTFNEEQFKTNVKAYYIACEELAKLLTELFALALDLPIDYIANKTNNSYDLMRLLKYPALDESLGYNQGLVSHTDNNLFTLITSTSSGVEYKMKDGSWGSPVMNKLDKFFVNLGDTMKYWSNDTYRSAQHRVILSKSERKSIVFFKRVNDDALMEAFPKCCVTTPAKYSPIIYKKFFDTFYADKIKALIK